MTSSWSSLGTNLLCCSKLTRRVWNFDQILMPLLYDVKMELESAFTSDEFDDIIVRNPSNSGTNNNE